MTIKPVAAFIVDAFSYKAFSGNPAAVCILNEDKSDSWLQQVAAEFNLSETAFLRQQNNNHWHLRWFTPTCEVKLCGHATLASTHVLLKELKLPYSSLTFSSLSGDLAARIEGSQIALNFPRIFSHPMMSVPNEIDALGLNQLNAYTAGEDIILELAYEADVTDYQPDFAAIKNIIDVRGLIITAPSATKERDFVSRFFAPNVGINEDPVTGSAHCSLGDLWFKKLGKKSLRAEQLSKRRGFLEVVVHEQRVELIGECVTVLKGQLCSQ